MSTTINKHYTTIIDENPLKEISLITLNLYAKLPNETKEIINFIEDLVLTLLIDLVNNGNAELQVLNTTKWQNFFVNRNGVMQINHPNDDMPLVYERLQYKLKSRRFRFALIVYVLGELHQMLLMQRTCSYRELYYKNTQLTRKQCNTDAAIKDVCFLLNKSSNVLGMYAASKGLIAGKLLIHLDNGDIVDCNNSIGDSASGTLLPQLLQSSIRLETEAEFVLLVEKDTVFRKLLSLNILSAYNCLLLTGKGYPDLNTRYLVQRLSNDCRLPIYAIFDADPFGIEIMLIYRHGSRAMALHGDRLACPQLQWLGIHPTELVMFKNIPTASLLPTDMRRVRKLLQRSYLSYGVRHELECLLRIRCKAQIEAIAEFLLEDYIPNKIRRNLLI